MAERQILTIGDFTADTLSANLQRASELKAMHRAGQTYTPLQDLTVAVCLPGGQVENRFPCLSAVAQVGARAVDWSWPEESEQDEALIAVMLDRMVDLVIVSTQSHERLLALSARLRTPLINASTSRIEPVAFLADAQTFAEQKSTLRGKTVCWLGPASNRCHAYIQGAVRCGFNLRLVCPVARQPDAGILAPTQAIVKSFDDIDVAIDGCDMVVFDELCDAQGQVMSDEATQQLLESIASGVIVIPGSRSAPCAKNSNLARSLENRLFVWKAILEWIVDV